MKYLDFFCIFRYNTFVSFIGGNFSMKSIKISLEMAQRVKEFVNITQKYSCEILLKSGKYVVDAKSILGIFSLDLSLPVTVEIYDDNCNELVERLKKFEA